jgi:hypothetical protein
MFILKLVYHQPTNQPTPPPGEPSARSFFQDEYAICQDEAVKAGVNPLYHDVYIPNITIAV